MAGCPDGGVVVAVPPGFPSRVGLVLAGRQAVEIRETGVATPIGGEAFELIEGGEYVFAVREGPGARNRGRSPIPTRSATRIRVVSV